jgi:hypothetical protein
MLDLLGESNDYTYIRLWQDLPNSVRAQTLSLVTEGGKVKHGIVRLPGRPAKVFPGPRISVCTIIRHESEIIGHEIGDRKAGLVLALCPMNDELSHDCICVILPMCM